jgi:phospholipid/cholesterol/gamma-HCH transport system permease protein
VRAFGAYVGARVDAVGEMAAFFGRILRRLVPGTRTCFAEALRQAGLLITGSVLIISGLVFVLGLQCGIEGAYGAQAVGAPSVAGAFTALCDLREVTPYAFGYMMAAKVGTGFVAELGSMRISDEIDALDVMGMDSVAYLCVTRLLGMWMVIPFVYMAALCVGFTGSYVAVVQQLAHVSPGGYLQLFWQFQNPIDLLYSTIKAMAMSTFIVLTACYFGYTATGGPMGVGRATARSMAVNLLGIHVIGLLGSQLFWGTNANAPIGG